MAFITKTWGKEQELEKHLRHEALPKSHGQCWSYLEDVYFCRKQNDPLLIIRETRWYSRPGFKPVKMKQNGGK